MKTGDFTITVEYLFDWQSRERYGVTCRSKHHDLIVDRIAKKDQIASAVKKCQMDLLAAEIQADGYTEEFKQAWAAVSPKMEKIRSLANTDVNSRMLPTTYS